MVASEAYGWFAAFCSMLSFGSFGAPIKSRVVTDLDVDPLVFQSYKTLMCFLTCWGVLLLGEEFSYTPWGLVSGIFWVPGGVATVFAIKTAGLGVGVGVGSSLIVLVSFTWGIFIFHEPIRSKFEASTAVFLMVMGIIGMSVFSAPQLQPAYSRVLVEADEDEDDYGGENLVENASHEEAAAHRSLSGQELNVGGSCHDSTSVSVSYDDSIAITVDDHNVSMEGHEAGATVICGYKVEKRMLGILAAVFNGLWGGSILVPMHFSGGQTRGIGYVISFAIGASIVTVAVWFLRFMFSSYRMKSFRYAYSSLPSFHFRKMWLHGMTSGTLWSIGNFFSMISVANLGEGVGYSVVQSAMLISGLWGVFYFKEVKGFGRVCKWFLSAGLTVTGILLLSYEHRTGH